MARDLDFSPRRRQIPTKPADAPGPARAAAKPSQPTELNHGTAHLVWLWILIIVLIGLGTWALWQYFKPAKTTKSPTPVVASTQTAAPASTSTDKSLLAQKVSTPTIQIYDSGAGADKVKIIQDKLKALGYTVDNLDKSQFNYDKTYVWYRAGLETEASKVGSMMPDRQVALKVTNISGTFDILILLGTN